MDYRRLNIVTKKDAFPIPRVIDCLDAVAGAVLFSTMDITAAYNQIPVHTLLVMQLWREMANWFSPIYIYRWDI